MSDKIIYIAYEDDLSRALVEKVLSQVSSRLIIGKRFWRDGSGYLKRNIRAFNELAKGIPFLLLTDLDTLECPPALVSQWIHVPLNPQFFFCVAVREVEAWLLADREAFSKWLHIAKGRIPATPESVSDPKRELISLVKACRNSALKRDIVPPDNSTAQIGRNYNLPLIRFVNEYWDVFRASENSASLARMVRKLEQFYKTD